MFLGSVPTSASRYLASTILKLGQPLINPCAGEFTIPQAVIAVGVKPQEIHTSDISLFSSLLGFLADPTKKIEDLGIRFFEAPPEADSLKDELDFASQVMLALRFAQIPSTQIFGMNQRDEVRARWRYYRDQLRPQLEALVTMIKGVHYEIRDVHEVIAEAKDREVTLFASLPSIKGGYKKYSAARFSAGASLRSRSSSPSSSTRSSRISLRPAPRP